MATGLFTASQSIKNSLATRNYYNPNNVYDINNNSVTNALNAIETYTPFNIRGNIIMDSIAIDNGLIESTPIMITAIKKETELLLLNQANKVIQGQIPVKVEGKNTINKIKNVLTGNYSKFRDLSITSKDELNKNIITNFSDIIDLATSNDFGYSKTLFEKVYGDIKIGDLLDVDSQENNLESIYNLLGDFTKEHYVSLTNNNYYGNRRNDSTPVKGYSPVSDLLNKNYFTFKNTDKEAIRNYISGDGKTKVDLPFVGTKGNKWDEFINNTSSNFTNADIEGTYGFGSTTNYDGTQREDLFNSDVVFGDSQIDPKRGLLHFTKNILSTELGKNLQSDNVTYIEKNANGNNIVHYKGRNECRSWTNKNKYGVNLASSSLTFNQFNGGNGVDGSVMQNSAVPKMFLKQNDDNTEKRKLMFSFENLAFDTDSYNTLPETEQGAFGGRLMWFAPYGIEFTENHNADIDSQSFIGRPEKVYSYKGVERTASLSFMLLMDYPLTDYKLDRIDYTTMSPEEIVSIYKNCDDNGKPNTNEQVKKNNDVKKPDPILPKDDNSSLSPILKGLKIYFDNNSNIVNGLYNPALLDGTKVNDDYNSKINNIKSVIKTSDGYNHEITIESSCSSLWSNDYNAQLGFRRAYNLMLSIYSGSLKEPDNFVDNTFTKQKNNGVVSNITATDVDKTTFTFVSTDNSNIKFILTTKGEEVVKSGNDITSDKAIIARYSLVKSVNQTKGKDGNIINDVKKPVSDIDESEQQKNNNDNTSTDINKKFEDYESPNQFTKSIEEINFTKPSKKESNYMQSFRPVYRSQTPFDFHSRLTFLAQCLRPGKNINESLQSKNGVFVTPKNSIFGKIPVIVLRYGDFLHTKILIKTMSIKYEKLTDLNPNGHGVQPMVANVQLDIVILGGQSLQTPIAALQNAISYNYYANSTYKNSGFDPYVNNKSVDLSIKNQNNQMDRYKETIKNFNSK